MDRAELSSAIIQEMQAVVGEALATVTPEQRVQQVDRVILGGLIERVAAGHAQVLPRPARCAMRGGALKRRECPRPLVGLVGDYTPRRAYYWCAARKRGAAPLDAALGLGAGIVSPGLTRVVARAAVDAPFTPAVEQVQEALGATLSDETARRLAEHIGAVAEAQTQAAIVRTQQGQPVWTEAEVQRADDTTILAVEVDGVLVHQEAGWHEMKGGTLAPLGPALHRDPTHGRATLAWGAASYGVGGEDAEAFWWRVYVEALRRGLGTPAVGATVCSPTPLMLSRRRAAVAQALSCVSACAISRSTAAICSSRVAMSASIRARTAPTTTGSCWRAWRWLRTCWRTSTSASRWARRCCNSV